MYRAPGVSQATDGTERQPDSEKRTSTKAAIHTHLEYIYILYEAVMYTCWRLIYELRAVSHHV